MFEDLLSLSPLSIDCLKTYAGFMDSIFLIILEFSLAISKLLALNLSE